MTLLNYKIVFTKRKSIALSLDDKGEVLVRAPKRTSRILIDKFVHENQAWIQKRVQDNVVQKEKVSKLLENNNTQQLKNEFERNLSKRMGLWAKKLNINFNKVRISNAKKRWGSCSSKGVVSITWRLVFAPQEVLDYVIVHELIHLNHMNHSKRFWLEVQKVIPDYKKHKKWLKSNDHLLKV